ncbi:ATP-binding protein [Desulfobacterales bacterium HSG17]|nr:ATP-binding protein [Desulfobacterales bacterium HSG17]
MEYDDQLKISSNLKNLAILRRFIGDFCARAKSKAIAPAQIEALKLAVNEFVTNTIKHGYHGEDGNWIIIEAEKYSNSIVVKIFDWGGIFDPDAVPPPSLDGSQDGGMGLYIIKNTIDEVIFSRDENARNCAKLTLYL